MSLTFVDHTTAKSARQPTEIFEEYLYVGEKVSAVLEFSRLLLFKFLRKEKSNDQ